MAALTIKGSGTSCSSCGPLRSIKNFRPDPLTASLYGHARRNGAVTGQNTRHLLTGRQAEEASHVVPDLWLSAARGLL